MSKHTYFDDGFVSGNESLVGALIDVLEILRSEQLWPRSMAELAKVLRFSMVSEGVIDVLLEANRICLDLYGIPEWMGLHTCGTAEILTIIVRLSESTATNKNRREVGQPSYAELATTAHEKGATAQPTSVDAGIPDPGKRRDSGNSSDSEEKRKEEKHPVTDISSESSSSLVLHGRNVVFLDKGSFEVPIRPVETDLDSFNGEESCPESSFLYHGNSLTSPSIISSFTEYGVTVHTNSKSKNYYSTLGAAYWTTSSAYAT